MDFVNAVGSTTAVSSGQLDSLAPTGSSRSAQTPVGAVQTQKDGCLDNHQQSATRSLQALAKMAKTQIQKSAEDDDDCIVVRISPFVIRQLVVTVIPS